jgi:hypothetical protein
MCDIFFEKIAAWPHSMRLRPKKGSAIGAVTPEREKKQAAVDSIDALIGAESFGGWKGCIY